MMDADSMQSPTPGQTDHETPEGWAGILERGERILWQGGSDGRINWADLIGVQTVFGIFFTGFSVFWVTMAASMMGDGRSAPPFPFTLFPLFGIPFILVGLQMVIGRLFTDAWKRRHTHNTLTTRAAYVATNTFGKRKLERTGVDEMTTLELEDGTPGTVWFGEKITHSTSYNKGRQRSRTHRRRLGFRQIESPREVFGLLRDAIAANEDTAP